MSFEKLKEHSTYGVEFKNIEDYEKDLKENYTKPGHPIAFSGIHNIFEYYRGVLTKKKIKNILFTIQNYTLHKQYKNGVRNPSYSHFPRYQFQMDLVDMQDRAKYNKGVRYLLTVIDTFTRYAFIRMLKDKRAPTVLDAFKSILTEAVKPPIMIVCDRGAEFQNKLFKKFCRDNNIKLYVPDTSIHAAYIERFNLTMQLIVEKYLTENETNVYYNEMGKLVTTYNTRKHRMIQVTPKEAETNPLVHTNMRLNMLKYYEKIKYRRATLKIGDTVRISKQKGKFSRGYKTQSSEEIFRIASISHKSKIPLYFLESYDGKEKLRGGFYDFELTKTNLENVFRVERIIRRRQQNGVKQLFVKWKGFDTTYNSWVDAKDIKKKTN